MSRPWIRYTLCFFLSVHFFLSEHQALAQNNTLEALPLDSILLQLQKNTPFPISFAQHLIPKDRKFLPPRPRGNWKATLQASLELADLTYRIIGSNVIVYPQKKYSLHGYIYDAKSGESLPGAHIILPYRRDGIATNGEGFYQLTLPEGVHRITITYLGYQPKYLDLDATVDKRYDFRLIPSLDLPQIIVDEESAKRQENSDAEEINKQLPLDKLSTFPGLGSSMDLTRYLQFVPGVSSGSDGFGGIHVRGGGSDQNLFLLDGIPVYNPFHMLGASSIFNAAALQQVTLSKNYFHAGQGERLSSNLDIRMRDGHREKTTLSAGLSLLGSHAILETPLFKKRGTLMVAGQMSHAGDLIRHYSARLKTSRDLEGYFHPKFRDFYAKAFLEIDKTNKLIFNFYQGNDRFTETETYEFTSDTTYASSSRDQYRWGNTVAGVRWLHAFKSNIYAKTSAYFSSYDYQSLNASLWNEKIGNIQLSSQTDLTEFRSRIAEQGIKSELDILAGYDHKINLGFGLSRYDYTPGIVAYDGDGVVSPSIFLDDEEILPLNMQLFDALHFDSWQLSGFIQDTWAIDDKWSLNFGLRTTLFSNKPSLYFSIQPRLNLRRSLGPWDVDLSYSAVQQPNHLITTEDNGLPNELWVPSTSETKPATAQIFDLKISVQTTRTSQWQSSLYYKEMNNIVAFRDDPSYLSFGKLDNVDASTWESDIAIGYGRSWGIENSWLWQTRSHYLKCNYTYAKSTRHFIDKYLDYEYPYQFERPHEFAVLANLALTSNIEISLSWQWGSGVALPLIEGQYDIIDSEQFFQETISVPENEIDLLVMPAYHHLDLSASYQIAKKHSKHIFKISLLNAYNQSNITFPKVNYDALGGVVSFRTGLPFIPSLSYQISLF